MYAVVSRIGIRLRRLARDFLSQATILWRTSFIRNLGAVGACNLLSRLVSLSVLGYGARKLGPEQYGLAGFALSIVAYSGTLSFPGLPTWAARHVAQNRAEAGSFWIQVVWLRVILAIGVFGATWLTVSVLCSEQQMRLAIMCASVVLLASAFNPDWLFNGLELMRWPAMFSLASCSINAVLLVRLVHSPQDLSQFLLIPSVATLVSAGGLSFIGLRTMRVQTFRPRFGEMGGFLRGCAVLTGMAASSTILHHFNTILIMKHMGERETGNFLAAFRLLELSAGATMLLTVVFGSRVARLVKSDIARARQETKLFGILHIWLGMFVATLVLIGGPEVMHIIYGAKFNSAIPLLQLLAPAFFFNWLIIGQTNLLISFGKDRVMFLQMLVSAICTVCAGLVAVPHFGAYGAVLSVCAADLSGWAAALWAYRQNVGSSLLSFWGFPFLAGTICSSLAWVNSDHSIIALILKGVTAFFIFALLFMVRDASHFRSLRGRLLASA